MIAQAALEKTGEKVAFTNALVREFIKEMPTVTIEAGAGLLPILWGIAFVLFALGFRILFPRKDR